MKRADGAQSNPDPIALSAGAIRLTRSEMEAQVRLTARRLNTLGIREGERVALLARNSIDWVLLAHAIPGIGATLVPINTRLTPEEIAFRLESSNAGAIVHDEGFAVPDLPILALTPDDLRAVRPSEDAIPDAPDPDHTCALLFTSGTTGRPKGVLLTWASQIASAKACAGALGTRPDDRWLVCMPLFHVGGLNILYRCSLAGARVVLHERFDAAAVNAAIDHEGVTILSVVGVMLRRILEDRAGRPFPETLRAVVAGGGAVEADLIKACPQATATYGLTETCSMITLVPLDAKGDERFSAGRPLPGIEIRIVDADGNPLLAGATGAIEVRGPVVMSGYLGEEALRPREWFRTGDMGSWNDTGSLRIAGRRADLIVSGGENIYPAEIEAALLQHPVVVEAVAIGIPDAKWGEIPLAIVVVRDPAVSAAEITRFLEERLARYKIPRIVFDREIPQLPNGKPDRASLASRFAGQGENPPRPDS